MEPILSIRKLRKAYGSGTEALKSVDHRGGFDAFLLKAKDDELPPRMLELKRAIVKKQAEQAA